MKDHIILRGCCLSEFSSVKSEQNLSMRDIYRRYVLTGDSPSVRPSGLSSTEENPIPAYGDVVDGASALKNSLKSNLKSSHDESVEVEKPSSEGEPSPEKGGEPDSGNSL